MRIFNPEHDLALASNLSNFTAPHAGRQLRADLSFLPSLWAKEGDIVIVDDIDAAETQLLKIPSPFRTKVEFCTFEQIPDILKNCNPEEIEIDTWGWDPAIHFQLNRHGIPKHSLPSKEWIAILRELSSRQTTEKLIPILRQNIEQETCGEAIHITDIKGISNALLKNNIDVVIKAPWSSSGRGVKYIRQNDNNSTNENIMRWINNIIKSQGGVMMEPYYNKVKDFAMEFHSTEEGNVEYAGLSLFSTHNSAYTGSIIASEKHKRSIITKYIDESIIDVISSRLCSELTALSTPLHDKRFPLHFGVDMMVVANNNDNGFLLHPCVEINVRRTMGITALALSKNISDDTHSLMNIVYESNSYKLKITRPSIIQE